MRILLDVFLLILGFALLIKSAEVFVNASVDIARRLKVPNLVIGLTIMAMGTSAPELMISVSAAIRGSGDLAVANVVGSNIFNLIFIVGICAVIYPIDIKLKEIARDYWVSAAATILLLVVVMVFSDHIPPFVSFILLAGFITYMFVVVRHAQKNKIEENDAPRDSVKPKPLVLSIFLAALGAAVIVGGGYLTVFSAVNIALAIGVTERVIGLTIVAIGTSLPELVTTIIACRKREGEFALGFIIGSNIFNIMFVLGVAGLITTLTVERGALFDLVFLTAGTLVFFLFARTGRRLSRVEGLLMALVYVIYMVMILLL